MKTLIRSVFVLTFVILFLVSNTAHSAEYKKITKEVVRNILLNDKNFKIYKIFTPLCKSGFEKGVKQEMWDEKGRIKINGIDEFYAVSLYKIGKPSVVLRKRPKFKVKIIGMYDLDFGRHFKVVDFHFQYIGVSSVAKRFVSKGIIGSIFFIKYDKGLNFSNIKIKSLREPFKLTNAELASQDFYVKKLHKKNLEEAARIAIILKESKRVGKIKKSFEESYTHKIQYGMRVTFHQTINIYSNYIKINSVKKKYNGYSSRSLAMSERRNYNIWMGSVKKIETQERLHSETNKKQYIIILIYEKDKAALMVFENNNQYKDVIKTISKAGKEWGEKYQLF